MTILKLASLFALIAAALMLQGCDRDPDVVYLMPSETNEFGTCGAPPPAGEQVNEFTLDGHKFRMMRNAGLMCEYSAKGAFLTSYSSGTFNNALATHVFVDRSGFLMDDLEFGPIDRITTEKRSNLTSNIDAIVVGLLGGLLLAGAVHLFRKMTGRSGNKSSSAEGGLQIVLDEQNFPHIDVVRALGAGAVLSGTNGYIMNVVDPRRPKEDMKWLLDESWHIYNADDLEDAFQHLLRFGHAEVSDWLIAESFQVSDDQLKTRLSEHFGEERDPTELSEFAANFRPAVEWMREAGYIESDADLLRGTSAFDIDRAIWLVRTALGAKYISRRTALDMVMYAGDHARARFGSWREYGTSVLLGRAIWGGVNDPGELFAERAKVVDMLLTDPRSTWVTAGWWPPLEDSGPDDDLESGEDGIEPREPGSGATIH